MTQKKIFQCLLIVAALFIATQARADSFVDVTIDGNTYHSIVGNPEHGQELYFLQKALKGDEEAREMLINNKFKGFVVIGIDPPIWVKVTKDEIHVVHKERVNG